MKVQCFLQKFTLCCTARDLRMLQIKIFISNSAQEIIQTNKNGGFASHMQIKLPTTLDSRGPWLYSLVVEHITVRRSCSQLFEVEQKHCVVNMGITCQDLTNHRISQNRDIGSGELMKG